MLPYSYKEINVNYNKVIKLDSEHASVSRAVCNGIMEFGTWGKSQLMEKKNPALKCFWVKINSGK